MIKHVDSIEYPIPNGVTQPLRCILEDNTRAVVKIFNNVQGNLTLVNEYICYKMAQKIDIPMPSAGLCMCDDSTMDLYNDINASNWGIGFYSTYIEKNTLLKMGIMRLVENIDIFYKIVIFDHLIYNKDRNIANLLVEYSNKRIYISVIDHSHVFKNQTIWDKYCFETGISDNDYNDIDIMQHNHEIYQMFYRTINIEFSKLISTAREVQSILTDDILEEIIMSVPSEWSVSTDNLLSLKKYLIYRRDHLIDMCSIIDTYIRTA